jgi:hypothetical protein
MVQRETYMCDIGRGGSLIREVLGRRRTVVFASDTPTFGLLQRSRSIRHAFEWTEAFWQIRISEHERWRVVGEGD